MAKEKSIKHGLVDTLIISISTNESENDNSNSSWTGSVVEIDSSNQVYKRLYVDAEQKQERLFGSNGFPLPIKKEGGNEDNDYSTYKQVLYKALEDGSAKNIKNSFSSLKDYRIITCINGNISYADRRCYVKELKFTRVFSSVIDKDVDTSVNDSDVDNWISAAKK